MLYKSVITCAILAACAHPLSLNSSKKGAKPQSTSEPSCLAVKDEIFAAGSVTLRSKGRRSSVQICFGMEDPARGSGREWQVPADLHTQGVYSHTCQFEKEAGANWGQYVCEIQANAAAKGTLPAEAEFSVIYYV